MTGYISNLNDIVNENVNFRKILYTTKNCQLVLMNLRLKEEVGNEIHPNHDQFFSITRGHGNFIIDSHEYSVTAGDAIIIPAGISHNIINTSITETFKFYTLYCPPYHQEGMVRSSKIESQKNPQLFDGVTST